MKKREGRVWGQEPEREQVENQEQARQRQGLVQETGRESWLKKRRRDSPSCDQQTL